jgi:hypothetical protein
LPGGYGDRLRRRNPCSGRKTGASKNTIAKLLEDAGKAFDDYQDKTLRGLTCKRIQVDEIWAFVHCKAKNVATAKAPPKEAGDCWTWLAIDADTKLIPSFHVGARDGEAAQHFIGDLALRLANRVQLTSDGHKGFAVEGPMTDDRPWEAAAQFARSDEHRITCGPRGTDRDTLAAEFRHAHNFAGVPPGSILRAIG